MKTTIGEKGLEKQEKAYKIYTNIAESITEVFAKNTFFLSTQTKSLLFYRMRAKIGVHLLGKIDKKGGYDRGRDLQLST